MSARGPSSSPPAATATSTPPRPPRPGATGDGLALALRAGAEVADVEMVQFHPTVLWTGPGAEGQQALVSEAVRGEGAVLVDGSGRRIMVGAHPLADLAPRDVVSATIAAHLRAHRRAARLAGRDRRSAPTSSPAGSPASCAPAARPAYDLAREPVPVAPAAHYTCGGVLADLDGRTVGRRACYAVGEVACTGVHGANRLASNSITEGLVAARRCADAARHRPARRAASRSSRRRGPRRDRPGRPAADHRGDDPRRRRRPRRRRACAGWPTCSPPPPVCRPTAAGPRRPRGHRAAHRRDPAGAPRRSPAPRAAAPTAAPTRPDTDPEWEVRLVHRHRRRPAGVHTRTRAGPVAARSRHDVA